MNTKFWKAVAAAFVVIALLSIIAEFAYGNFVKGADQGVQGFKIAGQDSYIQHIQQRFFYDLIYKYPILLLQVLVMALILEKASGAKNNPVKYGAAVGLLTLTPFIFFRLYSAFLEWNIANSYFSSAEIYFSLATIVAFSLGAIVFTKLDA